MVSLWPWKGEDTSPAGFEKALSALAAKISKSQSQLDSLRSRGRRHKALWTLYTSFAYVLCVIILFLVVGWRNWGVLEYTAVAGSPLVMYLIRAGISTYYTYRIDTVTQRLEDQQAERTKTIDKLKAATKYDSTQELLEKYGGATPKPKKQAAPKTQKPPQAQPKTVSMGPPATANIPRLNQTPSQPSTPQASTPQPIHRIQTPLQHIQASPIVARQQVGQAEFAPNAFSAPPQYAQGSEQGVEAHWYDRVLDLLMGEDETSPKNRVALICQNCRLVNGQAPPGTKSLADLGKWRCFGCGAMNGEEDEAAKVVKEIKERIETQDQDLDHPVESIEEKEVPSTEQKAVEEDESSSGKDKENTPQGESDDGGDVEDTIEVKRRRSRPRSSKKKA